MTLYIVTHHYCTKLKTCPLDSVEWERRAQLDGRAVDSLD
jgi:hypothetical protein